MKHALFQLDYSVEESYTHRCCVHKKVTLSNNPRKILLNSFKAVDLTYTKIKSRRETLKSIGQALSRVAKAVQRALPRASVQSTSFKESGDVFKLSVVENKLRIKIEPNTVIRGTVFPTQERALSKKTADFFELSVSGTARILLVTN